MIIYLKLLITMALWGGTFIAGRLVVQDMGAFSAAFCRFAIASLALLLLTYALEGSLPRPPKKLWRPIALLGLSAVGFSWYYDGLRQLGRGCLLTWCRSLRSRWRPWFCKKLPPHP